MIARCRHGRTSSGNAAWPALLACGLLLFIAGCGSNRPALAPVEGTVTHAGQPLEHGQIVFSPPRGRPAFGRIEQGKIVAVTTYALNDGAPLGSYAIGIDGHPPTTGMYAPPQPSPIPLRYANPQTSGLTVDIKAGATNEIHIDLARE